MATMRSRSRRTPGNLWTTAHGDTGLAMAAGTSPSIDAYGAVAFQGSDGNLWTWDGTNGDDRGLGMKAGTSPSIRARPSARTAPPPPTSVIRGGPDNDRLNGGSGNDLIRGGQGNDLIRGGRAGNDLIHGGQGNDRIAAAGATTSSTAARATTASTAGPAEDRIVDHRGATTAFAGSGANLVDVADGRGDDRVVCAPGSINRLLCRPAGSDRAQLRRGRQRTRPAASERALRRSRPILASK